MNTAPIADHHARENALNPALSFIVQAPAGSGKTELLIQRYLTLLAKVNTPEEILAITFTKKAAHEMRSRIIHALQFAANEPMPDAAHQQKTWKLATAALQQDKVKGWSILENANQCRIMTIDALCTFLTGQLPLLSNFGSSPVLTDDPHHLYQTAVLEVLKYLETDSPWTQDLCTLLLHLDNDLNKLLNLLTAMLAKRDQWQPYLLYRDHQQGAREKLETHLQWVISEPLESASHAFPAHLQTSLLSVLRFCATHCQQGAGSSAIAACETLTRFPEAAPEHLIYWQAISECLLTKSEAKWRSRADKSIGFPSLDSLTKTEKPIHQAVRQQWKEIIQALEDNELLRQALEHITELPAMTYTEQQWKVLSALLNCLTLLSAQLTVTFRQQGQIDFIENAAAALRALGSDESPTDLALLLDYQIQHILMDEFQDTSFTQYRLAEMLTIAWQDGDGRTLFVVGDPMQSIYRFRQAEVGLFLRMQTHGINHLKLHPIQLSVNFRSTAVIVNWNNHHFSKIFPRHQDVATGAVSYHASTAFNHDHQPTMTHVCMNALKDPNANSQAEQVAMTVESLLTQHPQDDIAILVKSRTHLKDILPALKHKKILYQAVDIDPLMEHPLIQDLFSFTRAFLHPADRIAWLSLLRSPWVGLSLEDTLRFAGETREDVILERADNPSVFNTLSDEGRQRAAHLITTLKRARYDRERVGIRASLESAWKALGGLATLTSEEELDIANTYFACLDDLATESISPTIHQIQKKLERLYANHQSDARVKIMTIHTSKGLEFDSVIIPHLERKNRHDDPALLLWMERTSEAHDGLLLLAPIHQAGTEKEKLYAYIEKQEKLKSDYELNRLLYVATTRAKKRLYLHCEVKSKQKHEESRVQTGSFLEKLWPHLNTEQADFFQQPVITTQNTNTKTAPSLRRLPLTFIKTASSMQTASVQGTQKREGFTLPDSRASLIGTLAHRLLQKIALDGVSSWPSDPHTQEQIITVLLTVLRAPLPLSDDDKQHVIQMINAVLKDEKGHWILKAHPEAQSEYSITYLNEGKPNKLIIDRTFIDESNTRWIIDYKTTTLNDKPLKTFIEEEKEKHQAQLSHYLNAMKQVDDRRIKLGLYFIALPLWVEVDL